MRRAAEESRAPNLREGVVAESSVILPAARKVATRPADGLSRMTLPAFPSEPIFGTERTPFWISMTELLLPKVFPAAPVRLSVPRPALMKAVPPATPPVRAPLNVAPWSRVESVAVTTLNVGAAAPGRA